MMRRFIVTFQLILFSSSIVFGLSTASGKIVQLTDNDYDDTLPLIHNGKVVWRGDTGNGGAIFYWDGTSVQQLTNDEYFSPSYGGYDIHNGQVVWEGYYSGEYDGGYFPFQGILYWDGISVNPLFGMPYT